MVLLKVGSDDLRAFSQPHWFYDTRSVRHREVLTLQWPTELLTHQHTAQLPCVLSAQALPYGAVIFQVLPFLERAITHCKVLTLLIVKGRKKSTCGFILTANKEGYDSRAKAGPRACHRKLLCKWHQNAAVCPRNKPFFGLPAAPGGFHACPSLPAQLGSFSMHSSAGIDRNRMEIGKAPRYHIPTCFIKAARAANIVGMGAEGKRTKNTMAQSHRKVHLIIAFAHGRITLSWRRN